MRRAARDVIAQRAERDIRRTQFRSRFERARLDLEARGVGGRIADKVGNDIREAYDEALEIAAQNKGVVAGTIGALMIWVFRNPLIASLESLLGYGCDAPEDQDDDKDR